MLIIINASSKDSQSNDKQKQIRNWVQETYQLRALESAGIQSMLVHFKSRIGMGAITLSALQN